jgi:superfamily II DNA helicase RecQ
VQPSASGVGSRDGARRTGRDFARPEADRHDTGAAATAYDPDCFERLRAWRLQQARADQIAPFMVFPDSTLRALAALPADRVDERTLAMVPGIGPAKLARYGQALVALLRQPAGAPDGEDS